jgi:hypothetical protein
VEECLEYVKLERQCTGAAYQREQKGNEVRKTVMNYVQAPISYTEN